MNALQKAQSAYRSHARHTSTDRDVEYDAFARVTHRLKTAADAGKDKTKDLIVALHDNRRLWSILASDVAGEDNGLPRDLRARIFYLAEFTRTYSSQVLAGASASPLVEINTAIMRGLRNRRPPQ